MQFIKCRADELVVLGKSFDQENLIETVLDGFVDSYKPVVDAINNRETLISFVTDRHYRYKIKNKN